MLNLLACMLLSVDAQPASHRVTSLPGFTLIAPMYSGYLQIPNSNGKELHYTFFYSQNNPVTDPVLLWLNGGPGCSSMEGAFMENGPYIFSETNSSSYVNPNSWNKNASVIYLEAPAGVGYSIMGALSNNATGDNTTAADNLQALYLFFTYFPTFKQNKFYIAGESYAGIYVPSLAYFIQESNKNSSNLQINLQGIMVGNGVTLWSVDTDSVWPYFLYWHQLIDDSIYFPWVNLNCSIDFNLEGYCITLYEQMLDLFSGINYYDVYRPCINPDVMSTKPHRARWNSAVLTGIQNCVPDNTLITYMNTPSVRSALHINSTLGAWEECTNLDYDIDHNVGSFYFYPSLIASGINIWIYSGDTDTAVSTYGSINWLNLLGLPTTIDWQEWMFNGQVAGFYWKLGNNVRFNTVRGAGHMCIQWKAPEGYQMFLSFIQGKDLV